MHMLEEKLSSLWKGRMVSQSDIAVTLEAGYDDLLMYGLLFSLSLDGLLPLV